MTSCLNYNLQLVLISAGNIEKHRRLSKHLGIIFVFPFLNFIIKDCDLRLSGFSLPTFSSSEVRVFHSIRNM